MPCQRRPFFSIEKNLDCDDLGVQQDRVDQAANHHQLSCRALQRFRWTGEIEIDPAGRRHEQGSQLRRVGKDGLEAAPWAGEQLPEHHTDAGSCFLRKGRRSDLRVKKAVAAGEKQSNSLLGCGSCGWGRFGKNNILDRCDMRGSGDEEPCQEGPDGQAGKTAEIAFAQGVLDIGQAMSPPLIQRVRRTEPAGTELVFIDAPPGTSCPVIESIRGADTIVLVTEPTQFGLHDLKLAVGMVRALGIPLGVVINRADVGDRKTHDYCAAENLETIGEIPDDRAIPEAYSRGLLICDAVDHYVPLLTGILDTIERNVRRA